MKPKLRLASTLLAAAVLLAAGCAREKNPPPKAVTQSQPAPATSEPARVLRTARTAATNVAAEAGAAFSSSWEGIKDFTYEKRTDVAASLDRLSAAVDEQVQTLKAKRASVSESSAKDWDFAMKELEDARADLRFKLSELNKATAETWAEARERAAEAWRRTQEAAARVKASTTS
ncbi:MAG TPA: hypothetical protein VM029_15185 [Opitutaceae bacterium]|nr:hypothetical protein [Opitutaceae bacterium]